MFTTEFNDARQNLTDMVLAMAADRAGRFGFGFIAADVAPETFEAVQFEVQECTETGRAFRVWSGGCEDIVYTVPEGNHAFRFWHDLGHAAHRLTFSALDEIALANLQLAELQTRFGIEADSLEARIFWADTVGQTIFGQRIGGFVTNQLRFVRNVVEHGIETALWFEDPRTCPVVD